MIRLTGRGAVALTVAVFTLGVLLAGWVGQPALAGMFFLAGSVAAVWWARRADLLLVAVSPPTVLLIVVVVISAITGRGGSRARTGRGRAVAVRRDGTGPDHRGRPGGVRVGGLAAAAAPGPSHRASRRPPPRCR
jgi:hypothetical protein